MRNNITALKSSPNIYVYCSSALLRRMFSDHNKLRVAYDYIRECRAKYRVIIC